jgi:hypothetical protein
MCIAPNAIMSLLPISKVTQFTTSSQQIELIETIEPVYTSERDISCLLSLKSITAFVKGYFAEQLLKYEQKVYATAEGIVCKAFVDGVQVSEANGKSFNQARTQAAILALQDRNYQLLKTWLGMHRDDLVSYLSII